MGSGAGSSIFELDGVLPTIDASAWVAPGATLIGQVKVGAQSGIWFGCVLRGDTNIISIGARTNIQDGSILHADPGEATAAIIGDEVTVGHACIIHGCRLMDRAFIGMGSTILNGAIVESYGMLAAGSLLTPGKRVPSGQLWAGSPARFFRALTEADRAMIETTAAHYVRNAARFKQGLRPALGRSIAAQTLSSPRSTSRSCARQAGADEGFCDRTHIMAGPHETLSLVTLSATPSPEELAAWQALPRDEQLRRLQEKLVHPDCTEISASTMTDILFRARAAVTQRRG